MTNTKLSATMEEALTYSARNGFQGTVAYCNRRTEEALLSRNMITYDHAVKDADGSAWMYPVLTVAGWKASGVERPADEGRLTLEECFSTGGWHAIGLEELAYQVDAGRLTLEEALAEAYTNLGVLQQDAAPATDLDAGRFDLNQALAEADLIRTGDPTLAQGWDPDAGRFDLNQALSFAYGFGPTEDERVAANLYRDAQKSLMDALSQAVRDLGAVKIQNSVVFRYGILEDQHTVAQKSLFASYSTSGEEGTVPASVFTTNSSVTGQWMRDLDRIVRRGALSEQEGRRNAEAEFLAREEDRTRYSRAQALKEAYATLAAHDKVIREANRLTRKKDDARRQSYASVYREHTPEDDMYVDRTAWKAGEERVTALRDQLRTSTQQRNTFEARNGRAALCGREMSTGRPCSQHAPEDTREQYTQRDTYGDPVTYRDVPVPADVVSHWYGVEAISWTRGVNAAYVQAVRTAQGR